ncbi:hypothetical protein BC477_00185 [Clavibacter michiganensis subsp. michiganensis]|uniref:Uncharacterized protein n=1 Tax=Clavibacter michiganensis subsp. michiganensis TaxID=33013 RepID=A0A251XG30_CLAMM|nr:hypothetical protein BC477_00185 [Clavibacter michiganensis subsp. michiganensis]OUE01008.1 hypothetical protein CMMCAS07_16330 [Clavibacter michiganensis subsp. michiganensis]
MAGRAERPERIRAREPLQPRREDPEDPPTATTTTSRRGQPDATECTTAMGSSRLTPTRNTVAETASAMAAPSAMPTTARITSTHRPYQG